MSDLRKLYEICHSQNADDASIDRLVAFQPFLARAGELSPGLILYVLDPMSCMGVDEFDQILSYTDDPRLEARLPAEDIERTKDFFRGNRQEIGIAFRFLEWMLGFQPADASPEGIQTTIRGKLMGWFPSTNPDVAQDIAFEYVRMRSCLWMN